MPEPTEDTLNESEIPWGILRRGSGEQVLAWLREHDAALARDRDALAAKVTRVEAALDGMVGGNVSCGGMTVDADGCFAADVARRVRAALAGPEDTARDTQRDDEGERAVNEPRRSIHRPPASATWEFNHRWGSQLGDSTDLRVTRTDGGSLRIAYGQESIEIREALIDVLAAMVAAAAVWTDDPARPVPADHGTEDTARDGETR